MTCCSCGLRSCPIGGRLHRVRRAFACIPSSRRRWTRPDAGCAAWQEARHHHRVPSRTGRWSRQSQRSESGMIVDPSRRRRRSATPGAMDLSHLRVPITEGTSWWASPIAISALPPKMRVPSRIYETEGWAAPSDDPRTTRRSCRASHREIPQSIEKSQGRSRQDIRGGTIPCSWMQVVACCGCCSRCGTGHMDELPARCGQA